MNPLQQQVNTLQGQVSVLIQQVQILNEKVNSQSKGVEFEEVIRNIVIFDQDTTSSFTSTTIVVSAGNPLTYPKVPDQYLKVYFRGKVFEIGVYNPV